MIVDSKRKRAVLLPALTIAACSGETMPPQTSLDGPSVDMVVPPPGVLDRGYDPAVVAIDFGGATPCAGTLIAPDVVATARHCVLTVVAPLRCPAEADAAEPASRTPDLLRVLVGEDMSTATERARARAVLVPADMGLCAGDVAMLLLDRPIDDVKPLSVRATGAALGDHVRTVGFSGSGVGTARKLLRDHLAVIATTPTELRIAEIMTSGGGGPALDETTEEVVGVLSTGDGSASVYVRADAFSSLVASALAESPRSELTDPNASKTKKGPADMGANCANGADCAAGVCVADGARQYCSRTCGPSDRCPTRFRCERSDHGQDVCVAT